MASKEECDKFAAELTDRFEKLTHWAMENWPKKEFPLLHSDFTASRREFAEIAGPRLGECSPDKPSSAKRDDAPPFIDMNPMPWP